MATLSQVVIPLVKQIVKTSNDQDLNDTQILGFLNQFVTADMPAQIQVFDLRANYSFQTQPLVDKYNVPIYDYTFYSTPLTVDGITQAWVQSPQQWITFSNPALQQVQLGTGDGTTTGFTFNVFGVTTVPQPTISPFVRAYYTWNKTWTDGIVLYSYDANNNLLTVKDGWTSVDSFPPPQMQPSNANVGYLTQTPNSQCGTVNYSSGDITVQFSTPPGVGSPIMGTFLFFTPGMPSAAFLYDNYIQLYPIPDRSYTIQVVAQRTPASYMSSSDSLQYTWMSEYLAYGTGLKILSYVMDTTQYNFYAPLFKQQENYVLRRTSRQNATQRVYTPYANQVDNKQSAPFGAWRWF